MNPRDTPFERSLAKRIAKAYSILEILASARDYSSTKEANSIPGLSQQLTQFELTSEHYFAKIQEFVQIGAIRKQLFKGNNLSIREVSYEVKKLATRNDSLRKRIRDEIQSLHAAMFAQNPLPAPFDIARPSFEKDLATYHLSYSALMVDFKAMVARLRRYPHLLEGSLITLAHCYNLISEAEHLQKKIDQVIQEIYVLNEQRRDIFQNIRLRSAAITIRSRYTLGPNDVRYKKIYRHLLSIE